MGRTKQSMVLNEQVKVFRSIDGIGKTSVDSLAVDGFFTYGWFKAVETQSTINMAPIYIAVYHDGKVVAIAPCFVDLIGDFFSYGPKIAPYFQRIVALGQRLGLYDNHALLCYSPFCFRSRLLFKGNLDENHILGLLVRRLDAVCKENGFLFSAFLFVSEFDSLLMENLQGYGFTRFPNITTYYLDVVWSSFDEYLKSLKKRARKAAKREMKKFEERQEVATSKYFAPFSEKLSELAANLSSKYSKTRQKSVLTSLFLKLNEYANDKTKLFVAKKNNEIVGFSMSLRHKDTLDSWIVGFDYDAQAKTDFAYFNLCYYLPVRWAIDVGIKKIYYRWKTENVKVRRGCKPEKTYAFVKCNNHLLSILINGAMRNRVYSYFVSKYLRT